MEQDEKQRDFIVIEIPSYSKKRFDEILGNKYDLGYWTYLTKKFSSMNTSNCFQSIAYIFRIKNHWLVTANSLISSYKTVGKNKIKVQHDKDI
jgi:tRNA(Glu) U13 pseudouridine synthase TruD